MVLRTGPRSSAPRSETQLVANSPLDRGNPRIKRTNRSEMLRLDFEQSSLSPRRITPVRRTQSAFSLQLLCLVSIAQGRASEDGIKAAYFDASARHPILVVGMVSSEDVLLSQLLNSAGDDSDCGSIQTLE
ncbi:hypothetical protein LZ31DRAFT_561098 [Colletotrichum somersetense]|nr:hypothetical protein LZ31DRAFT_561098 [Colletotrichum somersetense]